MSGIDRADRGEGFGVGQGQAEAGDEARGDGGGLFGPADRGGGDLPGEVEDVHRRDTGEHRHQNRVGQHQGGDAGGDQHQHAAGAEDDAEQIRQGGAKAEAGAQAGEAHGRRAGAAHERDRRQPQQDQAIGHRPDLGAAGLGVPAPSGARGPTGHRGRSTGTRWRHSWRSGQK